MLLVYGGAFNPPTKAHLELSVLLKSKFDCNFLFVPVGNSYGKTDLIPFEHRYNMVEIIANKTNSKVLKIEDNEKYLGTYELLKKLKEEDKDIYFVLGADNLININNWINAKKLIAEFKFIVLNRNNYDCINFINTLSHPKNFTIIEVDYDISSSEYRQNKNNNIINEEVLKYIKENNLYEV